MEYPSFEQFVEVVRSYARLKHDRHIGPETQLQRDLGMSADKGADLLQELERHYGIKLPPESFGLKPHERLFETKAAGESPFVQTFLGTTTTEVRPLTVGQLCRTVLRQLSEVQRQK